MWHARSTSAQDASSFGFVLRLPRSKASAVAVVALLMMGGAAGCGSDDTNPDRDEQSGEAAGIEGSCDGQIRFGGLRYLPIGGSNVPGIPKDPVAGHKLGEGRTLPCPDSDGDEAEEEPPVPVYKMIGVAVSDGVMVGEGPEPYGRASQGAD